MGIEDISGRGRAGSRHEPLARVSPATASARTARDDRARHEDLGSPARALVPVAPQEDRAGIRMARAVTAAGFLAQLVATSIGAEQTRARRRASPADTRAAYRATHAAVRSAPTLGGRLDWNG